MATQLEKLMFSIDLLDKVTGPAGKIQKTLGNVASEAQDSFSKITAGGAGMAAAGYALHSMAAPAQEFNMAIAEVRSLDVRESALDKLSDKAIKFSIEYGESATDFVKSSYDIQSAIAGLTGDELASFTNASNILAKGTKSDAATITNYMGTMYGIFETSAEKMGKAEWVEQLTGQTGMAVQMFKTTGTEMAGAFSSLGASAAAAGIEQAEQIAVLGSLQATMSGSEAGTKYTAFLSGVGKAQKKLGLKFTDSNDKMLGMVDILEKIKGKFGNFISNSESDALKEAFGSDEAVKLINQLIPHTSKLSANIQEIGNVKGMDNTVKMAKTMVDPFQQWAQGVQAVRIGLGQALLPVITPVVESMAEGAGAIYNWTQEFPNLTRWIGYGVVLVTGLIGAVAAMGAMVGITSMATMVFSKETQFATLMTKFFGRETIIGKLAMAGWNLAMKAATFGMNVFKGALLATRTGFLWLNSAMLANPIGLVIAGVATLVAGVGAAIYYWDDLKSTFKDVGWIQSIMGWIEKIAGTFKNFGAFLGSAWGKAVTGCVNTIVGSFQSLNAWLSGVVSGLGQTVTGWIEAASGSFQALGQWLWDVGAKVLKVGAMIFLFTNPIAGVIALIGAVIYNWDNLKAAFLDSTWGQALMGWIDRIITGFKAFGGWLSGIAADWRQSIMGWGETIAGGFQAFGQWLWDVGAKILKVGAMIFLFTNPIGLVVLGIRTLISHWDELKATFLDSAWGQAIMGWIDKITGGFTAMSGSFNWVKDKLSWIPGIGNDPTEDIPKTSPSLDAPRRSSVIPGGASQSIANAVTNNNRSNSNVVHVGRIVTSRSINPQEISSHMGMFA
jgi:TP901 family phage tail tape measure protein